MLCVTTQKLSNQNDEASRTLMIPSSFNLSWIPKALIIKGTLIIKQQKQGERTSKKVNWIVGQNADNLQTRKAITYEKLT